MRHSMPYTAAPPRGQRRQRRASTEETSGEEDGLGLLATPFLHHHLRPHPPPTVSGPADEPRGERRTGLPQQRWNGGMKKKKNKRRALYSNTPGTKVAIPGSAAVCVVAAAAPPHPPGRGQLFSGGGRRTRPRQCSRFVPRGASGEKKRFVFAATTTSATHMMKGGQQQPPQQQQGEEEEEEEEEEEGRREAVTAAPVFLTGCSSPPRLGPTSSDAMRGGDGIVYSPISSPGGHRSRSSSPPSSSPEDERYESFRQLPLLSRLQFLRNNPDHQTKFLEQAHQRLRAQLSQQRVDFAATLKASKALVDSTTFKEDARSRALELKQRRDERHAAAQRRRTEIAEAAKQAALSKRAEVKQAMLREKKQQREKLQASQRRLLVSVALAVRSRCLVCHLRERRLALEWKTLTERSASKLQHCWRTHNMRETWALMRKNAKVLKKFVLKMRMAVALHRQRKERQMVIDSADMMQHFLTEAKARQMKSFVRGFIRKVIVGQRWWRAFLATTNARIGLMDMKWDLVEKELRDKREASFTKRLRKAKVEYEREVAAQESVALAEGRPFKRDAAQDDHWRSLLKSEKTVGQKRFKSMEVPAKVRRRLLAEWLRRLRKDFRADHRTREKYLEKHRVHSHRITTDDIQREFNAKKMWVVAKEQERRDHGRTRRLSFLATHPDLLRPRGDDEDGVVLEEEGEEGSGSSTFITSGGGGHGDDDRPNKRRKNWAPSSPSVHFATTTGDAAAGQGEDDGHHDHAVAIKLDRISAKVSIFDGHLLLVCSRMDRRSLLSLIMFAERVKACKLHMKKKNRYQEEEGGEEEALGSSSWMRASVLRQLYVRSSEVDKDLDTKEAEFNALVTRATLDGLTKTTSTADGGVSERFINFFKFLTVFDRPGSTFLTR